MLHRPKSRLPAWLAAPASLALLATAVPGRASAEAGFADLASIDQVVANFTGAAIGMPGGATLPIDRRLRLSACSSQPAVMWRGIRHDAVLVQCPDAGSWRIFVPVQGQPGGGITGPNAIERGDAITISIAGDGFSVSQPGEALDAGAVGDWIRVHAVKDGAPAYGQHDFMRAQIVRPGEVEVPLP